MLKIPNKINLNPLLFNNVYWHLEEAFKDDDIRYVFVYGGSSASKTYSVVQQNLKIMLTNRNDNSLIMRKVSTDIKDSIYQDFKTIIGDWVLTEYFLIQQNYIKCLITGSYVRFRGLDDSEKVKGITGFKRVILEEISQFDYADLKQIRKRLRGKAGQQIIGIFNPISENHWIKTEVFDSEVLIEKESDIAGKWVNEQGNMVILKTNYTDNVYIVGRWKNGKLIGGFVDKHVIADFEKDKITDNAYYQIYGLGNWGKIRTGGEFLKDFNANIHLDRLGWDKEKPLHISWDENVHPYLTCEVWQLDGKTAKQIDEICLPDPKNRRHHVCEEFKRRYHVNDVKGLFVYGDKTSQKEDTSKEKGENFFTDIMKYLSEYHPSLRLPSANPSVKQSGDFVNAIYAGRIEGLQITIDVDCKKSINDYQYTLEDADGGILKKRITHPVTKISYEEYGHCVDAMRYFITMVFTNEYNQYIRGNRSEAPIAGKNVSRNSY